MRAEMNITDEMREAAMHSVHDSLVMSKDIDNILSAVYPLIAQQVIEECARVAGREGPWATSAAYEARIRAVVPKRLGLEPK